MSPTNITGASPGAPSIDNPEVLVLPDPGQTLNQAERNVKVIEIKITKKLNVKNLKDLMKAYGLPVSGKREILLERLRTYAADPEQWTEQFLPARGRERGDISERRAGNSHAARRIITQFGNKELQSEYAPKRTTAGGKITRTIQPLTEPMKAANNAWVRKVLGGIVSKPHSETPAKSMPDQAGAGPSANVEGTMPSNGGPLTNQSGVIAPVADRISGGTAEELQSRATTGVRRLERRVVDLNRGVLVELEDIKSQLSCIHASMSVMGGSHRTTPVQTSQSLALTTAAFDGTHMDDSEQHPHPMPSVSDAACSGIPTDRLRVFELDGERIWFDKAAVPDPPHVSFAEDISRLFREWHQSEILVVGGRGIPVKHWALFYKKRTHIKRHVWDVIRAKWNKWKSIVEERERFISEEAFWATYSDACGNCFNQQSILAMLQANRGRDNARDAADALKFFRNDLTRPEAHDYFIYRKRNVVQVCEKPEAIARKWRELLADHPEVAAAWASMQANEPSGVTTRV
ncbi:hypothetical protein BN946_scf184972.g2 [Trametes cinnabarina]|uniref:SAP domain-containing protein n=1 Tax=Pycnoporus cinnabarinus TaxID=5643 RepID=A0A060SJ66_PYCCI|nr:hypothetical protein BN946_scf184972.g2 [Trametes cinnabarina]